MIALGGTIAISAALSWESTEPLKCAAFLLLSLIASGLELNVPQLAGALSANFVFVLLSILELSASETLLVGCVGTAVQVFVHRHNSRLPVSGIFQVSNTAVASAIGFAIYHVPWASASAQASLVTLVFVATVLYAMSTFPLAVAVGLAEGRPLGWVWRECNFRVFPYYIAGATLAALYHYAPGLLGGQSPLLLIPVAVLLYWSYHSYTTKTSAQRARVEDIGSLHLRTIEALAMAIEAKDQTSHTHLRRVQAYCAEVGRQLGLNVTEMDALRAAAVLHDIGKLAVPEHILSKPGRLTKDEFEKVKIHPVVGAEILERVNFPYPVAPIVRCHHEKWNGQGYPLGLKGEDIPIGARILAVADSLDSLISDRPYRGAVSIDEAVTRVTAEAGLSFDPKVVEVVGRAYEEIEARIRAEDEAESRQNPSEFVHDVLSLHKASAQHPGASPVSDDNKPAFVDTIAAARQEAMVLLELTQELGSSLHLDETLAVLANGLRKVMTFDTLVIYLVRDGMLHPRYASGDLTSVFLSGRIPLGSGVAGRVAVSGLPEVNQPPDLEAGGVHEDRPRVMESAIAVPLPGAQENRGVIMACSRTKSSFGRDQQRMLMAVSSKVGLVIENALKYEQATASATTDFLTGLPNARGLQVQLELEIARCQRSKSPLTVLLTDLDGFKDVNDRFGHQEGDQVLRGVGKALRQSVREYDFVARMGGDEFVILLPGLGPDDVKAKIKILDETVGVAAREVVPESRVGLSVGQARFPEDGRTGEALLHEADQRMYATKQARKARRDHRGFEFDWTELHKPN
jgi:diguanylate cyclase (GGDEF)-like protein/putative nucleotidyltransferase with HDIG domain